MLIRFVKFICKLSFSPCGRCRGGPVDHPAKQERRPSRRRDLEHGFKARIGSVKKKSSGNLPELSFLSCGRWDLNPHKRNAYKILSLARLPVPTLPHTILTSSLIPSRDLIIITKYTIYVNKKIKFKKINLCLEILSAFW